MISGIQSVLIPIVTFFDSLSGFFLDFINGLANLVAYLKIAIDYARDFIDWVPIQVKAVLFVAFSIALAYKILGREG